jgi:hypothetical protein
MLILEQLLDGVQFGVTLFLMSAGLTLIFGTTARKLLEDPMLNSTEVATQAGGSSHTSGPKYRLVVAVDQRHHSKRPDHGRSGGNLPCDASRVAHHPDD